MSIISNTLSLFLAHIRAKKQVFLTCEWQSSKQDSGLLRLVALLSQIFDSKW